ncbi:MAG: hypothetical protein ACOZCL_10435 [Bacillota bacterium]
MIDENVLVLIKSFLEEDLPHRSDIEAVLLCGSYSLNRATDRSDIDLCYIGQFDSFMRENLTFKRKEIQLMIAPWSWYEEVIKEYERNGNIGTITTMIAKGICLWGESDKLTELQELGKRYYMLGPSNLSADETFKIKKRISDLWNNYIDQESCSTSQSWLCFHLVNECIESQFKLKQWWAVKAKHQLSEIREKDEYMAGLVEKCIESQGKDVNALETLCKYVTETNLT